KSCLFFFFSSRRRHTRFSRDWSSDVCSSDLGLSGRGRQQIKPRTTGFPQQLDGQLFDAPALVVKKVKDCAFNPVGIMAEITGQRSEERRVGKECRTGWPPDPENERTLTKTRV